MIKEIYTIKSVYLNREVELEVFLPDNLLGNEQLHLLVLNDGQESDALRLQHTLSDLYSRHLIKPLLTVAIKASEDRLLEYGVAGRPDFKNRGNKAQAYAGFVITELLPLLETQTFVDQLGLVDRPLSLNGYRAIAGFSLGGLSAFDIAYHHPGHFHKAGIFSGSFWWRQKDLADGYTDHDRIAHAMIRESGAKPEIKFWLMTGTEDETTDRNNNGIIDSIDDTIDLIRELQNKGFRRPEDIAYYEMVGGKHNPQSWAKALPAFLIWAFKFL